MHGTFNLIQGNVNLRYEINIVVLDNVRTNYVTPFSFVDEGKKIGEGFVLPLTKYEQQGETEERERCRDA